MSTIDQVTAAAATGAEIRAGGTDLTERRRHRREPGPVVDLRGIAGLEGIERLQDGRTQIGAMVTIATLGTDPRLAHDYPALSAAAHGLATPQIRTVGTIGGNLLQHSRCWYYRHPDLSCLKKGGADCPARDGNHLFGVIFDTGPCVAPHPSTLGMALSTYDADVVVGSRQHSVLDLYGDGSDGSRDHLLAPGALLTHVILPAPDAHEHGTYLRATSRRHAEWPLVEVAARLILVDGIITAAFVAAGGIAPVPRRLYAVEDALRDQPATLEAFALASAVAATGAKPLPQTGYKVGLLCGTVLEALERAAPLVREAEASGSEFDY